MLAQLRETTARMKQGDNALEGAYVVMELLSQMEPGNEASHLVNLLRYVDHKGADVKLNLSVVAVSKQDFPYPAFAWQWETVQAYKWKVSQHINVLELAAFLNYVRSKRNSKHLFGLRWVHVFDSRVVSCVIAKGRSSSKRVNRLSRRLMPNLVGMNVYICPLWTISQWMYADAASRLHIPCNGAGA